MNFSLPLNMRFFQKQTDKPVNMPSVAPDKPGKQLPRPKSNLTLLTDDDDAMPFSSRRPLSVKRDEALPKLTDGVLGTQVAEIMSGVAETLAKSCLYFTPSNLAILGSGPDVMAMLERMDPLIRATLMDGTMRPERQLDFRAFAECAGDLKAGAEAARLASQIFRLLHDSKIPLSGLAPLKKVTDSALRTLRTSAAAISSGDEATARMALKALAETEEMSKELTAMIPTLAAYRSPTICRLIAAALFATLVAAASVAEVASNLILPAQAKSDPLLSKL